ncbi:relaxin-3-like isoform X1 [Lethenteron reissneri]|uniref:relaxin-3-like isoform X1 n=1 Tax=Lethenteron reissneri TaxID=7753 RepID=UPI002AB6301A|nr:relaxin-3-like isoform X1 [Lethenteron reissneri]
MGCRMSLKVHMLDAHFDKFKKNMGAYSEEQGERFHQHILDFERRYQGQYNENTMGDYIWGLIREDTSTRGDTSDEFDPRSLWGESSSLQAEGLEAAASPSGDPEPGAPWRHLPGPRGLQRGDRATKAGLASVCCHWGCSKSDISTLC